MTLSWVVSRVPAPSTRGWTGKESPCQCRRCKRLRFHPWVGKIPWRRKWQASPVLLPGKSHGQRSLAGYTPWGRKESDTLSLHPTQPAPVSPSFSSGTVACSPHLGDPSQTQRINPITFFATHPSLLYTHPFTFYILDIPLLWTSLFPHVLCIPNSFFGNKVCICPSSSSLWSLIFRKLWP